MQVTTELRPLFSYSFLYIILISIFIVLIFIFLKFFKIKRIKQDIIIPKHKNLMVIKEKYLQKIQDLSSAFNENKISNRLAYQTLSSLIRNFIYESTNIRVHKCTLRDISMINMPILYELVKEYYDPEFSKISKGNITASINKTRAVIERWK